MPNEIKTFPYSLSVAAYHSDHMKRRSISQSSSTPLIWTISGIMLVACSSDGSSRGTSRVLIVEVEGNSISRGTLGLSDPVPLSDLTGDYGTLELNRNTRVWTYTQDNEAIQMLESGERVADTFTFIDARTGQTQQVVLTTTGASSLEDLYTFYNTVIEDGFRVSGRLLDENGNLTNIGLSFDSDVGIVATLTEIGFQTIRIVVSDGQGSESISTFRVVLFPEVENLIKVLGDGVVGAVVGDASAISHQFLIGGDNAQTLNAGEDGDIIFGGRGDDIINLGNGSDIVIYRYDGTNETNLVVHDGSDVINNFSLGEDVIFLTRIEVRDSIDSAAAFLAAIKGVSLLVDESGDITGVVLTFVDRDIPTQDINLTVNFESDSFISSDSKDIDLTAFNEVVDGRRTIKTGQEVEAHQAIADFNSENTALLRVDFMELGFELNSVETDIV